MLFGNTKHNHCDTEQLCMYGKNQSQFIQIIYFDCYCKTCHKLYRTKEITVPIVLSIKNRINKNKIVLAKKAEIRKLK